MNLAIEYGTVNASAKINGSGQAAVLTPSQQELLFTHGFINDRDRTLFAICLLTGARISEALKLRWEYITDTVITFPAATTKTSKTRQLEITPALKYWLDLWREQSTDTSGYVFPGRHGKGHLSRAGADLILREACECVGLVGVSTHSFRRTYISTLRDLGYSPVQIAKRTGQTMAALVLYLE